MYCVIFHSLCLGGLKVFIFQRYNNLMDAPNNGAIYCALICQVFF